MYGVTNWITNLLSDISKFKANQTLKFSKLMEYEVDE